MEGFAGIMLETARCYARIPGSTCHIVRGCWSGGGFTKSFCNHGYCMCNDAGEFAKPIKTKDGSTIYHCTRRGSEMTQISDEDQAESHRLALLNMMIVGMWALAVM